MRKKNIWIWNHYATNMFFDKAGRHYWFAERLIEEGYSPTIFCASTNHFSEDHVDTNGEQFVEKIVNDIPFVFINTPQYKGNGIKRMINIIFFYIGLFRTAKKYSELNEKPDAILASSVHPLTLIAGIKIAKKYDIPCICEVRDLWPESLVAYGSLNRKNIITKLLYRGEKWIYRKADSVVMTWKGGFQYIKDQGWDDAIDLNKVKYISNGILIESFDENVRKYPVSDLDLNNKKYKNLVYAGSIRKVNNLGILLDAAKLIQNKEQQIRFLIYGSGDEREMLENRCKEEGINNVIFKGKVEKKMIPSVLTKSYANILHNTSTSLDKYGQSQNKFYEYLAAGKCVIQTYTTGYSVLEEYDCGVSATSQTPEKIADTILGVCKDDKRTEEMGRNARELAHQFDFEKLTKKLIETIEEHL